MTPVAVLSDTAVHAFSEVVIVLFAVFVGILTLVALFERFHRRRDVGDRRG
jgi:hypothetical protein